MSEASQDEQATRELARRLAEHWPDNVDAAITSHGGLGVAGADKPRVKIAAVYRVAADKILDGTLSHEQAIAWVQETLAKSGLA